MSGTVKLRSTWNELASAEKYFAFLAGSSFCSLLAAYTALRPIRDELGIRGGTENLPWAFTTTFLAMLLVVPLFGAVASRIAKARVPTVVYTFFLANLLVFAAIASKETLPKLFPSIFFSWVSVFNLVTISLFWTVLSDRVEEHRARILFGPVAAGGSLGAFLGPLLTSQLIRSIGISGILSVSALLLFISAYLLSRLPTLAKTSTGKVGLDEPIGGEILQGLTDIGRSKFLRRLAYLTFVGNILGTYLYFEQSALLSREVSDSVRRTELLSYLDLTVNSLSLLFQLFLTPLLLARVSPRFSFTAVPGVLFAGFIPLALFPRVEILFFVQTLRRATLYALSRPVESVLFSLRSDEEGYKARNVIDTFIYRLGDTVGSWIIKILGDVGAKEILPIVAPLLAVSMAITTYKLGREHEQKVPKESLL